MQPYKTIGAPATAKIMEKKSEFIASAAPAKTEEQALAFLASIRTQHRTASHNVYAYVLREGARTRYSDDGEPAKTAGLPVLSVLTGAGLFDCMIVVTRYFGGTLLGTGGLVRAYTGAAQAVLADAEILTMQPCVTLTLSVPYPLFESARRIFEECGARLAEPHFLEKVDLSATMLDGAQEAVLKKLDELCRGESGATVSKPFFAPF